VTRQLRRHNISEARVVRILAEFPSFCTVLPKQDGRTYKIGIIAVLERSIDTREK
jgi:hypothetical protein